MSPKCDWCHRKSQDLETKQLTFKSGDEEVRVCGPDCETQLVDFYAYAESHVVHFLAGLLLVPAIGGAIAVWRESVDNGGLGYLIMGAGMGIAIIKYPFTTPQTAQLMGMKNAIRLARIIGTLLVLTGIVLFTVCNWFVA
ncbi:MAG: hypothetical protein QGG36_28680 [Pirellulaceae bacterium]|nr:hypothetical protein [Pirellulaceae bacterium]